MTHDEEMRMNEQPRWLTNTKFIDGAPAQPLTMSGQSHADALKHLEAWLSDKIIGRPKASEKYTVEQLESMGMRGVYAR